LWYLFGGMSARGIATGGGIGGYQQPGDGDADSDGAVGGCGAVAVKWQLSRLVEPVFDLYNSQRCQHTCYKNRKESHRFDFT